jgi:hypothetical protein
LLHGKLLLLLHKDLVWIAHYWHLSDHHVLNILIVLVLVLLSSWALILAITTTTVVLVEAAAVSRLLLLSLVVLWLLTTWIHLGHWVELLNDVSIGLGHCWHLHHSLRILVILHI